MGTQDNTVRLEIRLSREVKYAAEQQARSQGYRSLASMLTVVATQAAAKAPPLPEMPRQAKPPKQPKNWQQEVWLRERAGLPPPESVVSNHEHLDPYDVYAHQPDLYKFYLDIKTFNLKKD